MLTFARCSLLMVLIANCCNASEPPAGSAGTPTGIDPTVWLIRAPAVQAEMQLDARQRRRLQLLLVEFDPQLWALCDISPDQPDGAGRVGCPVGNDSPR
jgi:hypothetical protein